MEAHDRVAELIPRLRRYARALATTQMPADQLVRATLERAAQQLSLADAAGDLRVWLFGLMHEAYVGSELSQDSDTSATPAPRLQAENAPRQAFERAIALLPALQREIFLLVTLEDMSYEQVAKTLDIPLGTVMSRLSRAREKLRLQLQSQVRVRMVK